MTPIDRRRMLHLSGIATLSGLAGCSGTAPENTPTPKSTPTSEPEDGTTPTATPGQSGGVPGADQLGSAGNLQSSATVRAAALDSDKGAGRFVFTPAVVWVQSGTTITWNIEGAAHSVTAYHPDVGKPLRIPEDAASFDSETLSAGETYSHTFETPGVYNYFCKPHESLGMVGVVIVEEPKGGPGQSPLSELSGTAAQHLKRQLTEVAGLQLGGDQGGEQSYGWKAATWDSYWYSLYNMSTNISMSGNGVLFPSTEAQKKAFEKRFPAMLKAADTDRPPVKNPNLNMLPFTEGDPHFTQKPVLNGPDGRPDASTLAWDRSKSSFVVSPASVAYTHLKGVTWAKNFENHFDVLPASLAAKFRSMVLTTLAQLGVKGSLIDGGPKGNGLLTKGDTLELLSGVNVKEGKPTDKRSRPTQHAAMLWFLSDLVSLAQGGWFGYENPKPLIPAKNIQKLADGMAKTTMKLFSPADVADKSTRDAGELLAALGWYGTHSGSAKLSSKASTYANGLAGEIAANVESSGRVAGGSENQAATQGVVAQGLVWASQLDGVDHADLAADATGYLLDELWDGDAGTFKSGVDDDIYTITARDAGDITGGLNAADAVLGVDGVRETYAHYFDATLNRGRLQRAQRPPSVDKSTDHGPPLPPKAGGQYGQAAVYNTEVEYDPAADSWSVTDDRFDCEQALYLSNQEIWISQWGGEFFQGRGVPGESDTPK